MGSTFEMNEGKDVGFIQSKHESTTGLTVIVREIYVDALEPGKIPDGTKTEDFTGSV